jgi:chaperonin cofactor prefoldin
MAEALDVVQNVLDAWNGIQSKEVVLTTIQRTVVEGTATGPNYTGPQGPADPEPLTEEEQKAEEYTRLSSQLSGLKSSLQNYENQLKPLVERRNGLKTVMDMERGPNETSKHWPEYQSLQTKINDLITARNWTGKAIQDVEKQLKAVAPAKAPGALSWKAVATGGYIAGPGTATSDSIPAMLSNGEYVIKAATVKKFGTKMFDSINSGSLPILSGANSMSAPRFASVGSTVSVSQASVPSRQAAPSSSNSVYNYSLSVNVASQSDPNTIAQTVMNQLRMVDSQRIRGNRF